MLDNVQDRLEIRLRPAQFVPLSEEQRQLAVALLAELFLLCIEQREAA